MAERQRSDGKQRGRRNREAERQRDREARGGREAEKRGRERDCTDVLIEGLEKRDKGVAERRDTKLVDEGGQRGRVLSPLHFFHLFFLSCSISIFSS
jgi:hypothetical protein